MKNGTQESFLALIRLGVGHSAGDLPQTIDWHAVKTLAIQQGLMAIVIDGIEKLPESFRPPKVVLLEWIGQVLQDYERRYELYCRSIAEMAGFYNAHNLKMMVLKGYACSLDWPNPGHRPVGDIDIWQFGEYKKADFLLEKEKGISVDTTHHHHTVFCWRGFTVENHYDFINIHHHKSHIALEKIFKELGRDDSYYGNVYEEQVYLPSPNLHALFLLKHLMLHFASGKINFRQLLDWAFFVKIHGKDVDWKWFYEVIDEFHMRDFFDIINAICVENLEFDASYFPNFKYSPIIKDKVFKDLFSAGLDGGMPTKILPRIVWKIRRWKKNKWKHQLCYDESMWSAFWSGVWSHLLKPSSI